MEIVIALVIGAALGFAAAALGRISLRSKERSAAREEVDREVRRVAESVAEGLLPADVPPGTPAAELVGAIERGWAPRDEERRAALVDAVGRVSLFLDRQVRAPLAGASPGADAVELRERVDRALGALEDVDFFLTEPESATHGTDLVALAQQVSREFAADHDVTIRLQLGASSIRATVGPEPLMDALYLVLHNAVRFGGDATVDMMVLQEGGEPRIRVRDRGPGFSEEAFKRAFDPFYSESEDGMGLGLPHARKSIEAIGGKITLRNVPDGGAEVEIALPA
jgi:two-component system, NtrC family, C4-dicarboxylate transport sensor histidine kinase DctB